MLFRSEKPEPTLRLLPVYLQPASAGTGQWLDDDAQEMTEVDESVPAKAEFGVRIAGDSMEPRFVNGQTVWVKAAQDANNGDIVLCTLNDQGYCKKLRKDENGIAPVSYTHLMMLSGSISSSTAFRSCTKPAFVYGAGLPKCCAWKSGFSGRP